MTIPSSGALAISTIRNELSPVNGSYSLRSLSATACFGTPDAISEFYGYTFGFTVSYAVAGGGGGGGSRGLNNWGGGGGGGSGTGGAGGSGIIIIAYQGPQRGIGGTVDTTSRPGYTLHKFTTTGTDFFIP